MGDKKLRERNNYFENDNYMHTVGFEPITLWLIGDWLMLYD